MAGEEFKFNCPTEGCPQNYTATPDMVGTPFDCPCCQGKHLIPACPAAPPAAPLPAHSSAPSHRSRVEIDIKALPGPPKESHGDYYEIAYAPNDIRRFESIAEIKKRVLDGEVTRHNPCRHIYPRPDQDDAVGRDGWRTARKWRLIGESLALNAFELQPVYDPVAASRSRWSVWFGVVGVLGSMILFFCSPLGQDVMDTALERAGQALADTDGGMAKLIAWALVGAINAWPFLPVILIASLVTINLGSAVGYLIGVDTAKSKRNSLAPEDGYVSASQAKASQSFIDSEGRAFTVLVLGTFILFGGIYVMFTIGGDKRSSRSPVITTSTSAWTPYDDPNGRFRCLIPEGWGIEDRKEQRRSNVILQSGGVEIRMIARHTNYPEVYEKMEGEMHQMIAEAASKSGGKVRGRGVDWRIVNGTRAIQAELEAAPPNYLWARLVKFKEHGNDHTVGVYINSKGKKEELLELFEEFLKHYEALGE